MLPDDFWGNIAEPGLWIMLKIVLVVIPLMLGIAYLTYAERKVLALMQLRQGPMMVGPFGLLQPIADAVKLLHKETIIPAGANRGVFLAAPILTFMLSLSAWAVIPFGQRAVVSNINVGILYLFAISSLGVYGVMMAGWSSNSKYPFLGGLRAAAQMVSYEVSMGLVIVTVLLTVGSLNLTDIVTARQPLWLWLLLSPMMVVFYISTLAETNRVPFDLPEGESEIVGGFNTEYSSLSFGLFFLGEYANMILLSAHDQHPVPGRLAGAVRLAYRPIGSRAGMAARGAGRYLVRGEDRGLPVRLPVGARDFAALSLRPADAPGLENLSAVLPFMGCRRCQHFADNRLPSPALRLA